MDFLGLVNRTRRECGISSATLVSLSGLNVEDNRVKDWVAQAWIDLQLHKPDWEFMRKVMSFNTVAAQQDYTRVEANVADFKDWKRDSFRCRLVSAGYADEQVLPVMGWSAFRDTYLMGPTRTQTGRPQVLAMQPDRTFALGPIPDAVYGIEGEYYRAPIAFGADDDDLADPGFDLPDHFHMLVVFLAMVSYASYEAAPEVLERGRTEGKRLLQRLQIEQLPMIEDGAPLA